MFKIAKFLSSTSILLSMSLAPGALAQQITGTPGTPGATMTLDGKQLPPEPPKFGGVIKEDANDSKPYLRIGMVGLKEIGSMSKITSIVALGRKHTEGQRADFVSPLVWKGPQPSDSKASRHLIATIACVANLSGAHHPDKTATALIAGLKCLPLEVG